MEIGANSVVAEAVPLWRTKAPYPPPGEMLREVDLHQVAGCLSARVTL